ncbi:MAG: hypothetical protein N3B12_03090, partial [Armatimonadetes bacterium]|nr:hypothetical protein [Armatimonadota bacterium]
SAASDVYKRQWQDSAVVRTTLRGRRVWQVNRDPGLVHRIEPLGMPGGVLAWATPNRLRADGEFALFDSKGNQVTRGPIRWQENTRILAAPNGRYLCLSQVKLIKHKGKSVQEKHAVLLDASGRVLVDKGSLFFQAEPLLVTDQGALLLFGGKNVFFTMTSSGKLEVAAKAPGQVRRCLRSRDGTRALVECSGGKLLMLTLRIADIDRNARVQALTGLDVSESRHGAP